MTDRLFRFFIYATVLGIPLYLVRFSIFRLPTNLLEVLMAISFLLWIIRSGEHLALKSVPRNYWVFSGLIFLGVISSIILNGNYWTGFGILKGWFVFPFLFFVVILDETRTETEIKRILKILYFSALAVSFVSVFYLFSGNLTFDGRLKSIYLSPNQLAMFLAPAIFIGLFWIREELSAVQSRNNQRIYFLVTTLLLILTVFYFTFSHATWIATVLGLLATEIIFSSLKKSSKMKFVLGLTILLILIFSTQIYGAKLKELLSFSPRSSLTSRIMIWESALKIGKDNPILGIGPGNFQEKYLAYQQFFPLYLEWAVPQPHNLYLAFWLQSGLIGLLGFLSLVSFWIFQTFFSLRQKKDSYFQAALLGIIIYTLLHGMVDTPYWKNDMAFLFWIVIGLGIAYKIKDQSDKSSRQSD